MKIEKIIEVAERASEDEGFAEELREQARKARRGKCGSREVETLMRHFAASPEELARLSGQAGPGVAATGFSPQARLIMITTTSGGPCIPTITTTTALQERTRQEERE